MSTKQTKTKSTKRNTSKKSAKKASKSIRSSRVFLLLLYLLASLFLVVAFFRLGMLGKFFFGFFALFFGLLAWAAIPALWLALTKALFFKEKSLSSMQITGAILLFLSISLMFSLPGSYGGALGLFHDLNARFFAILAGTYIPAAGYVGALLNAALIGLIAVPGAWIVCILLFLAGIYMLFDQWVLLLIKKGYQNVQLSLANRQEREKPEKPVKKKKTSKPKKNDVEITLQDIPSLNIDQAIDDTLIPFPAAQEKQKKQKKAREVIRPAKKTDGSYELPPLSLLDPVIENKGSENQQYAKAGGKKLLSFLNQFKIDATLNNIQIGPSVTQYEISLGTGIRVNTITNLQNDIKMALAAKDIRIEAPIPGKSAIGIEIPNAKKVPVSMKEMMRNQPDNPPVLSFCLGRDLSGTCVYGNLEKMPHLLIAGATGSGKSVCVNSIISSILMNTTPEEVKLILIDPKKVEFTPYNNVPHLLAPVITEAPVANMALKVIVAMMDQRYDLFEEYQVRNIEAFNKKAAKNPDIPLLPRVVVIIDELADLMLLAAKEVEQSIQRITQLARAAGIHLIVATQRPSVNVITGVIKANIPSRIAFAVSSSVDSRTILDQAGAERLLGYGDMLFLDNGASSPKRIQGAFIQDDEVNRICSFITQESEPQYEQAFLNIEVPEEDEERIQISDPLYDKVQEFVISSRKASTSLIQRKFSIGYARAARLMDALEQNGIIGPARGSKPREVLVEA